MTALGSTPPFVFQRVFKEILKRKYNKDLDLGLGNGQLFGTEYFFRPLCAVHLVSGFGLEHILFQIRLITSCGIIFVNVDLYSKSNNITSITISLTFHDSCRV
jgi:hypothetical protein